MQIFYVKQGSKVILNGNGDLMMDKRFKQFIINKTELTYLRLGNHGAEIEDASGKVFKVRLANLIPINN